MKVNGRKYLVNYKKFSLFYKKLLPITITVMLILLIALFVLSCFSTVTYYEYYPNPTCTNFTYHPPSTTYISNSILGVSLYQLLPIGSMFFTLILVNREKFKLIKIFGIITSLILLGSMIWWLFYLNEDNFFRIDGTYSGLGWCGHYIYSWSYNVIAKQLFLLFIPNILLISFALILNIILSFLSAKNINEKRAKLAKTKSAIIASEKLRGLKKLLDEGVISQEIYDEKKKKYLELL